MRFVERLTSLFRGADQSCVEGICQRLADRLVFVPTVAPTSDKSRESDQSIAVDVICLENEEFPLIPVFTNERSFRQWCQDNSHSPGQVLSLLGGDLCLALEKAKGLVLDPLDGLNAILDPEMVGKVAESRFNDPLISSQVAPVFDPDPTPSRGLAGVEEVGLENDLDKATIITLDESMVQSDSAKEDIRDGCPRVGRDRLNTEPQTFFPKREQS